VTPEEHIVWELADAEADRVARRVVRGLQKLTGSKLSGDDTPLRDAWDEVCAQVQSEPSFHWDAYDDTVRAYVEAELKRVPDTHLKAVWLQTDSGTDWSSEDDCDGSKIPYVLDEVVGFVTSKVYELAAGWSNRRIRDYLEPGWEQSR
jgi:hypothetical protein